ncbi:hypothetical protein QQX09_08120 [Demequina sp. SYSU T00192]|uniref:HNH endonuclease n=1 Tax=Demequina litoralis TaxID=3051660 RepID=A0ABT8G9L6_9MICO|nr:hypothetical protein [Demequina sp. SYSU T00192]MDN4475821.1 hypothetical protein [Demequina sp. SYSU T00192]
MIHAPERPNLSLDNYADLLALAGIARDTGTCNACGPDSLPYRTDSLWLVHDQSGEDTSGLALLCAHHASDWVHTDHLASTS